MKISYKITFLVLFQLLFVASYTYNYAKQTTTNFDEGGYQNNKDKKWKYLFQLEDSKGVLLGSVYVKPVNDSVFSSLMIVKENGLKVDTLYRINKNRFLNINGLDIESYNDGLNWYKLITNKKDYFQITCIDKDYKESSDYVVIKWNQKKRCFKVVLY